MGAKGIIVRQTGDRVIFRESLKDSSGSQITSGPTLLRIFEMQTDGSLKEYDFNDNTFKTATLTSSSATMAHQVTNNRTYNTGLWTYALTTVSGFTTGNIYIYSVNNVNATPPIIEREFQYGSAEGDLLVTAGATGQAYLQDNVVQIAGSTTAGTNLSNTYAAFETGTAQSGGASTITLRSGASSVNDIYKDQVIFLLSGTGSPQTNRISSYVGSSKVATVETAWVTQPDNTSVYLVVGRIG